MDRVFNRCPDCNSRKLLQAPYCAQCTAEIEDQESTRQLRGSFQEVNQQRWHQRQPPRVARPQSPTYYDGSRSQQPSQPATQQNQLSEVLSLLRRIDPTSQSSIQTPSESSAQHITQRVQSQGSNRTTSSSQMQNRGHNSVEPPTKTVGKMQKKTIYEKMIRDGSLWMPRPMFNKVDSCTEAEYDQSRHELEHNIRLLEEYEQQMFQTQSFDDLEHMKILASGISTGKTWLDQLNAQAAQAKGGQVQKQSAYKLAEQPRSKEGLMNTRVQSETPPSITNLPIQPEQTAQPTESTQPAQPAQSYSTVATQPGQPQQKKLTVPIANREPQFEFGDLEGHKLQDIRLKKFKGSGIECSKCYGLHPDFLCGKAHEIVSHYVGEELMSPEQHCQICKKGNHEHKARYHLTSQHNWLAFYDHPETQKISFGIFEKWRNPYPLNALGWAPPSIKTMYLRMGQREKAAKNESQSKESSVSQPAPGTQKNVELNLEAFIRKPKPKPKPKPTAPKASSQETSTPATTTQKVATQFAVDSTSSQKLPPAEVGDGSHPFNPDYLSAMRSLLTSKELEEMENQLWNIKSLVGNQNAEKLPDATVRSFKQKQNDLHKFLQQFESRYAHQIQVKSAKTAETWKKVQLTGRPKSTHLTGGAGKIERPEWREYALEGMRFQTYEQSFHTADTDPSKWPADISALLPHPQVYPKLDPLHCEWHVAQFMKHRKALNGEVHRYVKWIDIKSDVAIKLLQNSDSAETDDIQREIKVAVKAWRKAISNAVIDLVAGLERNLKKEDFDEGSAPKRVDFARFDRLIAYCEKTFNIFEDEIKGIQTTFTAKPVIINALETETHRKGYSGVKTGLFGAWVPARGDYATCLTRLAWPKEFVQYLNEGTSSSVPVPDQSQPAR